MKVIFNEKEYEVGILFNINNDKTVNVVWPMTIPNFNDGMTVRLNRRSNFMWLTNGKIVVYDKMYKQYQILIPVKDTTELVELINRHLDEFRSM